MSNYIKITEKHGKVILFTGDPTIMINSLHIHLVHNEGDYQGKFESMTHLEVSYSIMCMMEKELMEIQKKWPKIEFSSPETDQMNAQMEEAAKSGENIYNLGEEP